MLSLKGTSLPGVGVGTSETGDGVTSVASHCVQHGADLSLLRDILPLAIVPARCCLLSAFGRVSASVIHTRVGSDLAAHLLPGGLFFSSCFSTEGRSETVECGLDPIDPVARSLEIFLNVCHPEAARPDWMTSSPYFGYTDTEALSNPARASVFFLASRE